MGQTAAMGVQFAKVQSDFTTRSGASDNDLHRSQGRNHDLCVHMSPQERTMKYRIRYGICLDVRLLYIYTCTYIHSTYIEYIHTRPHMYVLFFLPC